MDFTRLAPGQRWVIRGGMGHQRGELSRSRTSGWLVSEKRTCVEGAPRSKKKGKTTPNVPSNWPEIPRFPSPSIARTCWSMALYSSSGSSNAPCSKVLTPTYTYTGCIPDHGGICAEKTRMCGAPPGCQGRRDRQWPQSMSI